MGQALTWLPAQFGFDDKSGNPKYMMHDIMHILANATSGQVRDEHKAGIFEHFMLSADIMDCDVRNGFFNKRSETPRRDPEALGEAYARSGKNIIRDEIYAETQKIRQQILGSDAASEIIIISARQTREIEKLIAASPVIAKLEELQSAVISFPQEKTETKALAAAMDRYFRATHYGRKLDQFSLPTIMDMKLIEFGISAVEIDGRIQFPLTAPAGTTASNRFEL